jgi:hypothetical protein
VGSGEEIEAPAHTKFLGRHRGPKLAQQKNPAT